MTRQRNFAAEYAARKERAAARGTTVYEQREERGGIVRKLGFDSYSRYRSAAEALDREFGSLRQRGIWLTPTPKRGEETWSLMMEAKAILGGYSKKTIERASRDRVSLLEKSAKGRSVRDRLRSAFGFGKGSVRDWAPFYYPVMRALY